MTSERANDIALSALIWLAGNEDLLPVFLGATGAQTTDLRGLAQTEEFRLSVLEFLTMDDAWVVAFCDAEGIKYEDPLKARYILSKGEDVHWT